MGNAQHPQGEGTLGEAAFGIWNDSVRVRGGPLRIRPEAVPYGKRNLLRGDRAFPDSEKTRGPGENGQKGRGEDRSHAPDGGTHGDPRSHAGAGGAAGSSARPGGRQRRPGAPSPPAAEISAAAGPPLRGEIVDPGSLAMDPRAEVRGSELRDGPFRIHRSDRPGDRADRTTRRANRTGIEKSRDRSLYRPPQSSPRGADAHGDDDPLRVDRLEPLSLCPEADGFCRSGPGGVLQRLKTVARVDHQERQQPRAARPGGGRLALPPFAPIYGSGDQEATGRPTSGGDRDGQEGGIEAL